MYVKLVFRNAKRSVRDYLVYVVTMTICVTLFYSFLSISSRYYKPDIGSEYDFTMLSNGMKAAVCMITLCLAFLIWFVNRYMLQRKQKEFALQLIMGMEQKTVAGLFFAETLIMGMISIGLGIFFGVFCSQFITAMLLTSYGKTYQLVWTLFPDTVLLTAVFFILSFFAVGSLNTYMIRKTKIVAMLSADRENELELKKSRWIFAVVRIFEGFMLWRLITGIRKVWFYYDSRFAVPVQVMFWGNLFFPAVTLGCFLLWIVRRKKRKDSSLLLGLLMCSVCNAFLAASVPGIIHQYYLPLGSGIKNQYLVFLLADLLFFICDLIYLASGQIAAWKEKSPEHKYNGENLFFWGQIISKLNTTSKTMTLISITLVLAIVMFIAAPILTGWASGYLDSRSMYDVQIFSRYNQVYQEEYLPQDDYLLASDFLGEHGIEIASDCTFYLYLPKKEEFHNRKKYEFPAVAISLSDYNRILTMLGKEPIFLEENEFTTQWKSVAAKEGRDDFLREHTHILTDAGELTLSEESYYQHEIGQTVYNSYTNVLYVFPDSICESLLPVMRDRYILTERGISYADACKLEREFIKEYPERTENGTAYGIRLRTLQINGTKANNFVLQAGMIYAAVVLMVICLTILSLQQLLDAGQYRYRFSVLRKLGVEEQRIKRLVFRQLGVWFGLPVVVAVGAAVVVLVYFVQTISAEISAYIGSRALLIQIGATGGILMLLLICYFISTWILFQYSISE